MSSQPSQHSWIVDSIEEFVASVEVDGGKMITVPQWLLPDAVRQGDVLAVRHDRPDNGQRSALTIEIDAAATKRAFAASADQVRMQPKRPNDPGGDIAL